jgi:hypothetical protein
MYIHPQKTFLQPYQGASKLKPNRPLIGLGWINTYTWYHGKNQCWAIDLNFQRIVDSGSLNLSKFEILQFQFFENKNSESKNRQSSIILFFEKEPVIFMKELVKNWWVSGWLFYYFSISRTMVR